MLATGEVLGPALDSAQQGKVTPELQQAGGSWLAGMAVGWGVGKLASAGSGFVGRKLDDFLGVGEEFAAGLADDLAGALRETVEEWTPHLLQQPKFASAPVEKFADYIFKEGATHGKDTIFRSLGYGRSDSKLLANIWEEQAAAKFTRGEFTLGKADEYGQRINIEIEFRGVGDAAGKTSYIQSGWMVRDGEITLNTPYSGFTRPR